MMLTVCLSRNQLGPIALHCLATNRNSEAVALLVQIWMWTLRPIDGGYLADEVQLVH